jgi:hypothetical protein
MDGWTRMDGWTDGWMDVRIDGRKDGWMIHRNPSPLPSTSSNHLPYKCRHTATRPSIPLQMPVTKLHTQTPYQFLHCYSKFPLNTASRCFKIYCILITDILIRVVALWIIDISITDMLIDILITDILITCLIYRYMCIYIRYPSYRYLNHRYVRVCRRLLKATFCHILQVKAVFLADPVQTRTYKRFSQTEALCHKFVIERLTGDVSARAAKWMWSVSDVFQWRVPLIYPVCLSAVCKRRKDSLRTAQQEVTLLFGHFVCAR